MCTYLLQIEKNNLLRENLLVGTICNFRTIPLKLYAVSFLMTDILAIKTAK